MIAAVISTSAFLSDILYLLGIGSFCPRIIYRTAAQSKPPYSSFFIFFSPFCAKVRIAKVRRLCYTDEKSPGRCGMETDLGLGSLQVHFQCLHRGRSPGVLAVAAASDSPLHGENHCCQRPIRPPPDLPGLALNSVRGLLALLALILLLQVHGVNVSSLIAGLGIIGAIVGLALQGYAEGRYHGHQYPHRGVFCRGGM